MPSRPPPRLTVSARRERTAHVRGAARHATLSRCRFAMTKIFSVGMALARGPRATFAYGSRTLDLARSTGSVGRSVSRTVMYERVPDSAVVGAH